MNSVNAGLLSAASNFLANEERWDEAIDEAARGIILDPNDPEGYAAMGKVLGISGELTGRESSPLKIYTI